MSSVQQQSVDDLQDPGECQTHQRQFECFCVECSELICPSCLMFGDHKGHKVSQIEEASKDLRNKIDDAGKQGLLKFENSENVLLDIRHTKLTVEEKKSKIIKDVEQTFSQAMKQLKLRKDIVLNEINEHFNSQIEQIYSEEQRWVKKQEEAQELVNLARCQNDLQIIQKARVILDAINSLKEEKGYKLVQLINTVDSNYQQGKLQISFKEFLIGVDNFVKKGEIINMQYKC